MYPLKTIEELVLKDNRKMAPFSIGDIESDCPGISRNMIRQVLRKMRDEGEISVNSGGCGKKHLNNVLGVRYRNETKSLPQP